MGLMSLPPEYQAITCPADADHRTLATVAARAENYEAEADHRTLATVAARAQYNTSALGSAGSST